jgi:hypothetical protein
MGALDGLLADLERVPRLTREEEVALSTTGAGTRSRRTRRGGSGKA